MQLGRDADLVQIEDLESSDPSTLAKRDFKTCSTAGVVAGGTIAILTAEVPVINFLAALGTYSIVTVRQCSLSKRHSNSYSGCLLHPRK